MLHDTTGLGGRVFQICDHPAIESYDRAEPADVRATARDLGPASELGARGVRAAPLLTHLELARELDVTLVRSMLNTAGHRPGPAEATGLLKETVPKYADAGATPGRVRPASLLACRPVFRRPRGPRDRPGQPLSRP